MFLKQPIILGFLLHYTSLCHINHMWWFRLGAEFLDTSSNVFMGQDLSGDEYKFSNMELFPSASEIKKESVTAQRVSIFFKTLYQSKQFMPLHNKLTFRLRGTFVIVPNSLVFTKSKSSWLWLCPWIPLCFHVPMCKEKNPQKIVLKISFIKAFKKFTFVRFYRGNWTNE